MKHEASKVDVHIHKFFHSSCCVLICSLMGGKVIELYFIKWKFLGYLERKVDACEFSFLFKGVRILSLMSCARVRGS